MKRRYLGIIMSVLAVTMIAAVDPDCNENIQPSISQSRSGVAAVNAEVKPQADGLTLEQQNVKRRLELENTPGRISHLYLLSPNTGQVIFYSTVKGKTTSSGKRLSPSTKVLLYSSPNSYNVEYYPEILGDDGTYGSSSEYLYWFDQKNEYHQQFVGNAIVHISEHPMQFRSTTYQVEGSVGK